MDWNSRLLAVGFAVVALVLVCPVTFVGLPFLVLLFLAGWLSPDRPVAAASALTALGLLASVARLAVTGEHWLSNNWHGYYAPDLDLSLAALLVAGDLLVEMFRVWGWAVFMAYMAAGIALRRRIRIAA